jgi:hypothetical protein
VAVCYAARGAAARRMCQSRGGGMRANLVFLTRDPGLLDG